MSYSVCKTCCARHEWHWTEAFDKFGFNDGDGLVMTEAVADVLRDAGLTVNVTLWGMHNVIINSVSDNDTNLIPRHVLIGHDDPRDYLPPHIITLLDEAFPDNEEVEP